MGFFSISCMISGLPIGNSEPVRFVALSESPYQDDCTVNGRWVPLHLPIKGFYNDYGSIEGFEDDPITQSFCEVLSVLAVSSSEEELDLSASEWLEALLADHVRVYLPRSGFEIEVLYQSLEEEMGSDRLYRLLPRSSVVKTIETYLVRGSIIREDIWQVLLDLVPERPEHRLLGRKTHKFNPSDGYGPESALDRVIEYRRVTEAMFHLRRIWTPGHASGPQFPEWGVSTRFAKSVAGIAATMYEAHESGTDQG